MIELKFTYLRMWCLILIVTMYKDILGARLESKMHRTLGVENELDLCINIINVDSVRVQFDIVQ